jgi:hypothetical protein
MATYKIAAPDEYLAITGMGVKNGSSPLSRFCEAH